MSVIDKYEKLESFKKKLKEIKESDKTFLECVFELQYEEDIRMILNIVTQISNYKHFKKVFPGSEGEDKIKYAKEIADICEWAQNNFIYPDMNGLRLDIVKFMKEYGIEENLVYIEG